MHITLNIIHFCYVTTLCIKYIFFCHLKLDIYIIIILYALHFIGPPGDPGYEGFIIGTKGESGERGSILDINNLFQHYIPHALYVYVFL